MVMSYVLVRQGREPDDHKLVGCTVTTMGDTEMRILSRSVKEDFYELYIHLISEGVLYRRMLVQIISTDPPARYLGVKEEGMEWVLKYIVESFEAEVAGIWHHFTDMISAGDIYVPALHIPAILLFETQAQTTIRGSVPPSSIRGEEDIEFNLNEMDEDMGEESVYGTLPKKPTSGDVKLTWEGKTISGSTPPEDTTHTTMSDWILNNLDLSKLDGDETDD